MNTWPVSITYLKQNYQVEVFHAFFYAIIAFYTFVHVDEHDKDM